MPTNFCPKCGTPTTPGANNCANCGEDLTKVPSAAPAKQSGLPNIDLNKIAAKMPNIDVNKITSKVSNIDVSKITSKVSNIDLNKLTENKPNLDSIKSGLTKTKILCIVCAVVLALGGIIMVNKAIPKIPAVTALEIVAEEDISEEFNWDYDYIEEHAEDILDECEEELSKKEMKKARKYVDVALDFAKTPSLANIVDLHEVATDLEDEEIRGIGGSFIDDDEYDAIKTIMNIAIVYYLILAVIALVAGIKKLNVLSIIVAVLSFLPSFAFVGFLYGVLAIALLVVLTKSISDDKKANKLANGVAIG